MPFDNHPFCRLGTVQYMCEGKAIAPLCATALRSMAVLNKSLTALRREMKILIRLAQKLNLDGEEIWVYAFAKEPSFLQFYTTDVILDCSLSNLHKLTGDEMLWF